MMMTFPFFLMSFLGITCGFVFAKYIQTLSEESEEEEEDSEKDEF